MPIGDGTHRDTYLPISGPIVLYFTAGRQHARGSGRSAPPTGMNGSTESLTSHRSAIGGRAEGGTKSRFVESVAGHHLQMLGCTQDAPQLPIERMGQLTRRTVERERTER